jgi:hypothetical protein
MQRMPIELKCSIFTLGLWLQISHHAENITSDLQVSTFETRGDHTSLVGPHTLHTNQQ